MVQLPDLSLNPASAIPLYRQLADAIRALIERAVFTAGDRLPPTRELAAQLGLNRTTVSAAYALLEQAGQIEGQVGRGSFVANGQQQASGTTGLNWDSILPPPENEQRRSESRIAISFSNSSPGEDQLPRHQFRRIAKEVIESPEGAQVLHLGSSLGYAPLRRYLLNQGSEEGIARPGDDLMVTNGCQQALDLLARLFGGPGTKILTEDPVYRGLLKVFSRSGADLVGIPVDEYGLDIDALQTALQRHHPKLLVVTPAFQNPTGTTLPMERRERIVALAHRHRCVLVESDIYSELRYSGPVLPTLKQLDAHGDVILLRSYSKIGFPGLRVGWVLAPRPLITRLAELKECSDLHSDQLAQAILLRFAQSGELSAHVKKIRLSGAERLGAAMEACARYLPFRTRVTRPDGGPNLWVELPAPLIAERLLIAAQEQGVSFLPGSYFSLRRSHERCLRLSFGALTCDQIRRGIQILGQIAGQELAAEPAAGIDLEPAVALV